MNSTYF